MHTVVSQLGLLTTPGRDADGTGGGTEQKTRTEKTKADENHDELFVCLPATSLGRTHALHIGQVLPT